jgi:hypothetical protein
VNGAGTTAEFNFFLGRELLHAFVRSQPILKTALEFSDSPELEANGIRLMAYTFRAAPAPAAIRVLVQCEPSRKRFRGSRCGRGNGDG